MNSNGNAIVAWVVEATNLITGGVFDSVRASSFTPGVGWLGSYVLSAYPPVAHSRLVSVAINAQDDVVVAWRESDSPYSIAVGRAGVRRAGTTKLIWDWETELRWGGTASSMTEGISVALGPQAPGVVIFSQSSSGGPRNIIFGSFQPGSGKAYARLIDSLEADAQRPDIAVDGRGNAIAVWAQQDSLATRWDVWTSRYTPAKGWGPQELLEEYWSSDNLAEGIAPQVAMDPSGTAVALWNDLVFPGYSFWTVYANHFR